MRSERIGFITIMNGTERFHNYYENGTVFITIMRTDNGFITKDYENGSS